MIKKKLLKMLIQNLTRANFQKHYEEIVNDYNNEKDRVTTETTFENFLNLVDELSEEEQRAVKDRLSEESLVLFDLLLKPDISKNEIDRVKEVTKGLHNSVNAELQRIQNFSAKQRTQDKIKNYLRDEKTGLLESFEPGEVEERMEAIFKHLLVTSKSNQSYSHA